MCEGFGTVVPEVQGWLCPARGRVEGVDDHGAVMMVAGCRGGREPRSAARPEEDHAGNDALAGEAHVDDHGTVTVVAGYRRSRWVIPQRLLRRRR